MPSSSKILKSDQADTISQFSVAELQSRQSPSPVSAHQFTGTQAEPDSPGAAGADDTATVQVEQTQPPTPVTIFSSRTSITPQIKGQGVVSNWFVPEFEIETIKKNVGSFTQKKEDHSYLVVDAKTQANEIIAEANTNAAQILAEAKAEAESLKQKAFMDGMATAKNEASETMHQVERIFQETQLWQEQVMRQSQNRIMEMVLSIGKKLFGSGFELSADQIDHIVSRAINEASRLGNLRIYLHPEDAKLLVNLWQESEITLNGQQIQIVSSQNISRGGCFVDGEFGIVDGRVEEQVDQITESIKSAESNLENQEQEE